MGISNKMRKRSGIALFMVMVIFITLFSESNAYAAYKTDYIKLYAKKLNSIEKEWYEKYGDEGIDYSGNKSIRFCLLDLNGDGIKELIVRDMNVRFDAYEVYTYYNKKVKLVTASYGVILMLNTYSKKNAIGIMVFDDNSKAYGTTYYKIKNGKLKKNESCYYESKDFNGKKDIYYINKKVISKLKYKNLIKKYGNEDTLDLHVISSNNIQKYCN